MGSPLGSGEFTDADELGRLRRRAYGPDPDIADDPRALARLAELEEALRRRATAAAPVVAALAPPRPAAVAIQEPADERSTPGPELRRRGRVVVGAMVAVLALAAGYLAGSSRPLAPASAAGTIETSPTRMPAVPDMFRQSLYVPAPHEALALRSEGEPADRPRDRQGVLERLGIRLDELRRYESVDGLSVWSGESRYGMVCLFIALPAQGISEGYGAEGCAPEGYITIAEMPRKGRTALIRFVLRGDQVNVYVYEMAAHPRRTRRS